ncbi:MAG: hypothetical protein RLZZ127_1531 [Planctomycetota bacterium]|jgi:hypothetical protein
MHTDPWWLRVLFATHILSDKDITVRARLWMRVTLILAAVSALACPLVWYDISGKALDVLTRFPDLADHRDRDVRQLYELAEIQARMVATCAAGLVLAVAFMMAFAALAYLRFDQQHRARQASGQH